jgi:hypothetical protein
MPATLPDGPVQASRTKTGRSERFGLCLVGHVVQHGVHKL